MTSYSRDSAPKTAFLQDAALLASRSIVARLDRRRDFQPYFKVDLGPPARAVHDSWDYCDMAGRYVDAFALIRQVTGASPEPEVEAGLRRFLLSRQNTADGLFYNGEGENSAYLADMFCQSRAMIGLCTWAMDSGEEAPLSAARRLAHGLNSIAERRDGYAFYPRNLYREGTWLEGGLFYAPKDLWSVKPGYGGTQLEGLMQYHRLSGDEAVLPFVAGYLRYFLGAARAVAEDGSFTGHLHSQGIVPTMIGAAMFAETTGDWDLLALCERFLRFTLDQCSRFGWVPDGIGWPTCETCALGDVIHLAVRLSRLGQGDFWDVVERFVRNQLLENQFRDVEAVLAGRDASPVLSQIVRGSFASWAYPNDLLGGPDLEGCCTGGGARALFHALDNAVDTRADGTITVHLLLSLDTENALVLSALPYEGRVTVIPKRLCRLRVRLPEGLSAPDIRVTLDGASGATEVEGRYVVIDAVHPGARVELAFPQKVRTERETVAGAEYEVTWKGNTVLALTPEGAGYPIYLREEFRRDEAPTGPWPFPVQGCRVRW